MNNKEPGYVYILTRSTSGRLHICKNPSFREDWVKIGKSSRPVDVRSKELDNTFVPLSFEKRAQRFLPLLRPHDLSHSEVIRYLAGWEKCISTAAHFAFTCFENECQQEINKRKLYI